MGFVEMKQPNKQLANLVRGFREELAKLNNKAFADTEADIDNEMRTYFTPDRVVIGCDHDDQLVGFAVLKIDQGIYWLDWLFVETNYRGTTCASDLFDFAEAYAISRGCEKLYIWVHPDNRRMLAFLKKKGYDCLNLIEITKKDTTKGQQIELLGSPLKY